jgi:hypothetical protein
VSCHDREIIATSVTARPTMFETTVDRVEVNACCAPSTSDWSREVSLPVCVREKNAKRLARHVVEDLGAQAEDQPLADPGGEPPHDDRDPRVGHGDAGDRQREDHHQASVPGEYALVDDPLEQQGRYDTGHGVDDDADEEHRDGAAEVTGVREDTTDEVLRQRCRRDARVPRQPAHHAVAPATPPCSSGGVRQVIESRPRARSLAVATAAIVCVPAPVTTIAPLSSGRVQEATVAELEETVPQIAGPFSAALGVRARDGRDVGQCGDDDVERVVRVVRVGVDDLLLARACRSARLVGAERAGSFTVDRTFGATDGLEIVLDGVADRPRRRRTLRTPWPTRSPTRSSSRSPTAGRRKGRRSLGAAREKDHRGSGTGHGTTHSSPLVACPSCHPDPRQPGSDPAH